MGFETFRLLSEQIKMRNKLLIRVLFLICVCAMPFYAQTQSVKVENAQLESKLMARKMPYRVALPKNYAGDTNARYTVIYLLHGLFGHYDNWGDKTKIAAYLEPYNFIVVMPEGANGWYTDSATMPNDKYESYIVQELIPEIDKKFRTDSTRNGRIIAGLSMGGYGSLKFGLKHPEMFRLVGSFSGALGAATYKTNAMAANDGIAKSLVGVFGGDNSQTTKDNDIFRIVREIPADKAKQLPFIYLDCGTEDFLIQNNRDFVALLTEKKISHEYRQLPGAHTWQYWETQIQQFLQLAGKDVSKTKTN